VAAFPSPGLAIEQIWYLGDAVEGTVLGRLEEMAAMQVEVLGSFGVPVKYVLGNHDFDHLTQDRGTSGRAAVFRDAVLNVPGWRTTETVESFYFFDRIGEFTVLFLSDHADPRGRWISTHGKVHGEQRLYPYSAADYERVRDQVAAAAGPVITCSHYAFAGGNRPSALHDLMFPLPGNIKLHLYGHAHIGDGAWAGKDLYRKVAGVDDHPIVQCDVASLEDGRGSAIRSAVLEIYRDRSLGLFFRNHTARRWEEHLLLDGGRELRKA
jgi:Calcineurin-like phosphoesterase